MSSFPGNYQYLGQKYSAPRPVLYRPQDWYFPGRPLDSIFFSHYHWIVQDRLTLSLLVDVVSILCEPLFQASFFFDNLLLRRCPDNVVHSLPFVSESTPEFLLSLRSVYPPFPTDILNFRSSFAFSRRRMRCLFRIFSATNYINDSSNTPWDRGWSRVIGPNNVFLNENHWIQHV